MFTVCAHFCKARVQAIHIIKKFYSRPDLSAAIEVNNNAHDNNGIY